MPRATRAIQLLLSLGMAAAACGAAPLLAAEAAAPHQHPSDQHSQAVSSDTDVLVVLGQMQGHLLMAEELLRRGDGPGAEPHVGHPVDELYGSLNAVIAAGRLQPFRDSLELLRQQVRLAPGAAGTARRLAQAQQTLLAANAALAPGLSSQPAVLLAVARQLALTAASEYEAAVAVDRIAETIEYQDARGFLLQAQRLLGQASTATPAATSSLQPALTRIDAMLKAFPTTMPPQRIVLSVSRVQELAGGI